MSDTPRIEVTIAAPLDTVWHALRDRNTIRHWHGWENEGHDGEIDYIYFTHATENPEAHTLGLEGGDLIELQPAGRDTRVTLTRAPRGANPDWEAYYDDITQGWTTFLNQLRFAVERQPGAVRRTVFLNGTNKSGRSPETELGLPAQGTFESNLLGEQVKGEIWYRAEHQLGVTVDAWGDGMLILSSEAPSKGKPDGAATALLSTYGLDDARLADLTGRWTAWWDERFASAG